MDASRRCSCAGCAGLAGQAGQRGCRGGRSRALGRRGRDVWCGAEGCGGGSSRVAGPGPAVVRRLHAGAVARERRRARWLAGRVAVRQRARSRTAYRSLAGPAVRRLWGARLVPVLGRTAAYPQPGFRRSVVSFKTPYEAVIAGPGGRRDLAVSSTPLEASGGGAIDLQLKSSGGGFSPAAAAVPLVIDAQAAGGVVLPSLGIGVSMPAAAASRGGLVDGAGVLYPNIAAGHGRARHAAGERR